jgi:DNA-directed RNA polymerase specialized sigma24 family protein
MNTTDIDDIEDVVQGEDENHTEIHDKIKRELSKLSWYDRMLFQTYVDENHTISSLSRATGIPRTSISLSINRIKKHIRKRL